MRANGDTCLIDFHKDGLTITVTKSKTIYRPITTSTTTKFNDAEIVSNTFEFRYADIISVYQNEYYHTNSRDGRYHKPAITIELANGKTHSFETGNTTSADLINQELHKYNRQRILNLEKRVNDIEQKLNMVEF